MNDATSDNAAASVSGKMRVLFITEDDPLYVIRFFEVFFAEYPRDEFDIVAITVDEAFHEPIWKTARRMLRFYGPAGFVRLGTRFAAAKARGRSIATLARAAGVRELSCQSVNDPDYVKQARALEPDVIVSVAAPEIFRKDILNVARLRCVNIHSGRLPTYRGMMPTFWQLVEGEDHVTVTVHEMVEKLDAGDVLGTREFPLRDRDVLDRVIVGTKQAGARLMIDVLRRIAAGTDEPQPLDMSEKGYFSFPKPEDVRRFRARGHRLL
jgi:methionyl-tRNA formyltransferase